MVSVEEDDLAGLEDVSSDGEDDNYEAELTDGDSNSNGTTSVRRPYRKKARADSMEPLPLMEGEGKAFRVLGFNQNQRAAFVQILMRFGVGDFDWKEFTSRMKQKTYEEIKDYGTLFLSHIAEDITDSATFADGVPKEGLRIPDVLVRIAILLLIRDKVRFASEHPQTPLFSDDILLRYPGLKGARIWKEEHDLFLLRAVLKHGYGRWQAIVDDKDLKIQEVICQELNLPFINLPGQVGSQAQNGSNLTHAEVPSNQSKENGGGDIAADGAQGSGDARNQAQLHQESSMLYHFRDMQRRLVEFIKKRVLLLEKGLNAEYQKEYFGDPKANEVTNEELKSECKTTTTPSYKLGDTDTQMIDRLPEVETIASEDISVACDSDPNRLELVRLYNEMCKVVDENPADLVQASLAREPTEVNAGKKFPSLENICEDINRILTPTVEQIAETPILNSLNKSETISQGDALASKSVPIPQDNCKPDSSADNESKDMAMDSDPIKEGGSVLVSEKKETSSLPERKESNTEMDAELNENKQNSDAEVVLLDD